MYNYRHFKSWKAHINQFSGPKTGDKLPEMVFHDLHGKQRSASEFIGSWLVIETGTTSCDMYACGVRTRKNLSEPFPDVKLIVVFVREAHPGMNLTPHSTQEVKNNRAQSLFKRYGETRDIWVDHLDGRNHLKLSGGLPNVALIIDPEGKVAFRRSWFKDNEVVDFLKNRKNKPQDFGPDVNNPEITPRKLLKNIKILWGSGPDALFDFAISLPGLIWQHMQTTRKFKKPV